MAVTGRPKKQIDQKQFENLCALQCTEAEICDWFDCQDDTLNRWCRDTYGKSFSEVFRAKKGVGQISLRRRIWQHAEKNPSACIFLCKNVLGYTDKIQTDANVNIDSSVDMMQQYLQEKKNGK